MPEQTRRTILDETKQSSRLVSTAMQPRLLIIEDDVSTATAMQKVLRAENYAVDLAQRGDEGLAQGCEQPYDVVITDLRLPGLGGLELATQLHATKPTLPIIMMTGHGTPDTPGEATKRGVFEYVVKPFGAERLLELVATAVAHARRRSGKAKGSAPGS